MFRGKGEVRWADSHTSRPRGRLHNCPITSSILHMHDCKNTFMQQQYYSDYRSVAGRTFRNQKQQDDKTGENGNSPDRLSGANMASLCHIYSPYSRQLRERVMFMFMQLGMAHRKKLYVLAVTPASARCDALLGPTTRTHLCVSWSPRRAQRAET